MCYIGVSLLHKNAELVRSYLDQQQLRFGLDTPDSFWESVKNIGWHGEKTFVLPNEIIGEQKGVFFTGGVDVAQYEKAGDPDF